MCSTLSTVSLTVAATRIHRGLVDYASIEFTEQYDITPSYSSLQSHRCRRPFDPSQANGCSEWKVNGVPVTCTHPSRMEVTIPDMYEQDEAPKMGHHGSARSLIDVEGYGKPAGLENVENDLGAPPFMHST